MNRRALTAWGRREPRWVLDCVLLQRVILERRSQLKIVGRLAGIAKDALDDPAARNQLWHDVRKKLGKLRRLSPRDIDAIEAMIAKRIPKPVPVMELQQAAE